MTVTCQEALPKIRECLITEFSISVLAFSIFQPCKTDRSVNAFSIVCSGQHTITTTLISENQLHDKKKMKRFSKKVLVIGYT